MRREIISQKPNCKESFAMIHYIFADMLDDYSKLRDSMFSDRGAQFKDRLKWDVDVDQYGKERDQYEREAPLYLIAATPDGRHAGSMRFLPTTGRKMVHEHFLGSTDGVRMGDVPFIFEFTRFCLSPNAPRETAAKLMLGAAEMGLASGLSHAVGIFYAPMILVCRRLGWSPTILGTKGEGRDAVSVGLWTFTADVLPSLRSMSGIQEEESQTWIRNAFGPRLVA